MKSQEVKNKTHPIQVLLQNLKQLFENKKYLEVIYSVKKNKRLLDTEFLDYFYFDDKVACLIFAGISYLELGLYTNALAIFKSIELRYANIKLFRNFWKKVSKQPVDKTMFNMSENALKLLKAQIRLFNSSNNGRYLSNMAYTCYKLKRYKDAIKYYKKALVRNKKDIQLNLGIAQSQYRIYKLFLPKGVKKRFRKTIENFSGYGTSFDTLLAIGKMYYFLKEYEISLSFVQKALEFAQKEPQNKIYAYDWLSRIAYKTKHHSVAIHFYEEIIKCLVEYPDNQQDVIHPKPKMHDMLKYLNKNKKIVRNQEIRGVWYTVIVSIIFTIFFGIISNLSFFQNLFFNLINTFY